MKKEGVWLEITNLVVPSWTDNLEMIKKMCGWLAENGLAETPLHFSRFMPLYKLTQLPPTPVNILQNARDIAIKEGLKFVYVGNVPGVGNENTFCPKCNKLVVERRGYTILQNNLTNGKCNSCSYAVAGVWGS
jgi:pyruvate formate lyase activating enzyme